MPQWCFISIMGDALQTQLTLPSRFTTLYSTPAAVMMTMVAEGSRTQAATRLSTQVALITLSIVTMVWLVLSL